MVLRLGGGTQRKRHGLLAHVVGSFLFWLAGRPLGASRHDQSIGAKKRKV
jgi:hypothetical protein